MNRFVSGYVLVGLVRALITECIVPGGGVVFYQARGTSLSDEDILIEKRDTAYQLSSMEYCKEMNDTLSSFTATVVDVNDPTYTVRLNTFGTKGISDYE